MRTLLCTLLILAGICLAPRAQAAPQSESPELERADGANPSRGASPVEATNQEPEAKKAPEAQSKPAKVLTKPRVREFPAKDGLIVRADLYAPNKDRHAPLIVLFHQARWSRGEYVEIAPKLNAMGFNCLAVDLRSGGEVNGVINETHEKAVRTKGKTEYYDAIPDVIASLEYARKRLTKGKVIAWGSSYSASLVLHVAGTHPKLADAVLSFSPGEYFKEQGGQWVEGSAKSIQVPTFITSDKREHAGWKAIFDAIPHKKKTAFVPETNGNHGSQALWKKYEDSPAYWVAVRAFLNQHFPKKDAESKRSGGTDSPQLEPANKD